MKKFVFTLESLKRYQDQVLETEKGKLSELRGELNRLDGHEFTLKLYDLEDDSIYTFTKMLETDLLGFEHNLNAIKIPFSKFELEGTIMPDIIDGGEL